MGTSYVRGLHTDITVTLVLNFLSVFERSVLFIPLFSIAVGGYNYIHLKKTSAFIS